MNQLKKTIAYLGLVASAATGLFYAPAYGVVTRRGTVVKDSEVKAPRKKRVRNVEQPVSEQQGLAAAQSQEVAPRHEAIITLDLSNQSLPLLPGSLPAELEVLNAAGNDFGPAPQWALAAPLFGCPRLRAIDYSHCGLEGGLLVPRAVQELVLDDNDLSQQDEILATKLEGVSDFEDANEFRISWEADQKNAWALRRLSLRNCCLTRLPEGLPASLEELDLRGNDIVVSIGQLRIFIAGLPRLQRLFIDLDKIDGALMYALEPVELRVLEQSLIVATCVNLRDVDLAGRMEVVAGTLGRMPQLKRLQIENCQLTALPDGPQRLPETLEELDLRGNALQFTLQGAQTFFEGLPNLKRVLIDQGDLPFHLVPAEEHELPAGILRAVRLREELRGALLAPLGTSFQARQGRGARLVDNSILMRQ